MSDAKEVTGGNGDLRNVLTHFLTRAFAAALVVTTGLAVPVRGQESLPASLPADEETIQKAIDRGTAFLWSQWNEKTCWDPARPEFGKEDYRAVSNYGGQTALCVYALLACGASPQEARLAKSIDWLGRQKMDGTYALSLRANVWALLSREKYHKNLVDDTMQMLRSIHQDERKPSFGGYGYFALGQRPPFDWDDHSNSQFGVLGVWAGARNGVEVPRKYWQAVEKYWLATQQSDGGWEYQVGLRPSNGTMTAGGLATMFICQDMLHSGDSVACQSGRRSLPLDRAMEWFARNFSVDPVPQSKGTFAETQSYYYLYGLERVGLASGYKYFGSHDWYAEGLAFALAKQGADGSWRGSAIDTAFALLFLARGQHPVVFNHLEYPGDWDNRPRALANLTGWMSRTFERELNWQIVNFQVPVARWHDAPILYISGSTAPRFTDEQLAKLREFVQQGGTILSVAECNGAAFTRAMKDLYARLFPAYELKLLDMQHPIHAAYFKEPRSYAVSGVSNGVRLLAIHVGDDLSKSWQLNAQSAGRGDFQEAANIYFYITDSGHLRNRGMADWPSEKARAGTVRTIKVARLKYAGLYDPEPLAWRRFAILMANEAQTKLEVSPPMAITELKSWEYPVAHMTGASSFVLSAQEKQAMKNFCFSGGTLIIDAAGGNEAFRQGVEKLLKELFGPDARRSLALGSELYKLPGMEIDKVNFRRASKARLGDSRDPRLQAVTLGNRIVCLYSPEDITAGLVGYQSYNLDGYAPDPKPANDSAFRIMRNAVIWAASQSSKATSTNSTN